VSFFEKKDFSHWKLPFWSPGELTAHLGFRYGMAKADEMNPTLCQKTVMCLAIPFKLTERMLHMLSKGKMSHRSHPGLLFHNTSISILSFEKGGRIKEALTEQLQASKIESGERRKNRILIKGYLLFSECL